MNPSPTPYPSPTPPADSYYHGTDAYVNQMPHSMEFFYIPLNAVMSNYHTFDWHALDKELSEIAKRHHQAVVRFYLDYPDKPLGIPRFLLDGGLVTHSYPDYSNGVDATSVIPNYDDPNLLTALLPHGR